MTRSGCATSVQYQTDDKSTVRGLVSARLCRRFYVFYAMQHPRDITNLKEQPAIDSTCFDHKMRQDWRCMTCFDQQCLARQRRAAVLQNHKRSTVAIRSSHRCESSICQSNKCDSHASCHTHALYAVAECNRQKLAMFMLLLRCRLCAVVPCDLC